VLIAAQVSSDCAVSLNKILRWIARNVGQSGKPNASSVPLRPFPKLTVLLALPISLVVTMALLATLELRVVAVALATVVFN
jgi:hypothetical protein